MARILIAIDGSDFSLEAAKKALNILGTDHEFVVLRVQQPVSTPLVGAPDAALGPEVAVAPDLEETARKEAQAEVDHAIAVLGLRGRGRVTTGDPATEICRIADEERFDAVVVGSHGAGFVRRVLVGSVSHHVLHHAHVPVLVMRGPHSQR